MTDLGEWLRLTIPAALAALGWYVSATVSPIAAQGDKTEAAVTALSPVVTDLDHRLKAIEGRAGECRTQLSEFLQWKQAHELMHARGAR